MGSTHCNAGWLPTVDWGTALLADLPGAHDAGLPVHVWVDETRPRNQGASLTAWELGKHGVPHTVIADNAGGHLMQRGRVDICIVGTDRVDADGDVANKIGTYLKALAARDNGVPFWVALPLLDPRLDDRDGRPGSRSRSATAEEGHGSGRTADGRLETVRVAAEGSPAANPAFDVTPARLVPASITERGGARRARRAALTLSERKAASGVAGSWPNPQLPRASSAQEGDFYPTPAWVTQSCCGDLTVRRRSGSRAAAMVRCQGPLSCSGGDSGGLPTLLTAAPGVAASTCCSTSEIPDGCRALGCADPPWRRRRTQPRTGQTLDAAARLHRAHHPALPAGPKANSLCWSAVQWITGESSLLTICCGEMVIVLTLRIHFVVGERGRGRPQHHRCLDFSSVRAAAAASSGVDLRPRPGGQRLARPPLGRTTLLMIPPATDASC